MNLLSRLRGNRADPTISLEQWAMYFDGHRYPLGLQQTMKGSPQQEIENSFQSYVANVHTRHGTVAAAVAARSLLISQIQFKFRRLADGPEGALVGSQALLPLEKFDAPFTRERVLARAEQHVSYSGNAYFYRPPGGRVRLLNPDCVRLVIASDYDPEDPAFQLDAELVAYLYTPDPTKKHEAQVLAPNEVAQWAPEPHPVNPWIGQSWVTSVMSEVLGDDQLTEHQRNFYANAATPNMVITLPATNDQAAVDRFMARHKEANAGPSKAGKTLLVTDGADVKVVGSQLQQLELKDSQGGHESRIATRSRVPATVLGIREGLGGSALSTGNYPAARRMWADGWFSPTAQSLASAVALLVDVPSDLELTHDPSRVMFLQEDRKDEAEISALEAQTIRTLVDAGFESLSVVKAVRAGDWSHLKHSGLMSVQLLPPGTSQGAAA